MQNPFHSGLGPSLVAQTVKSLPATQETQVRSLGQEDPLEQEMATHSSIHAWKTPWREESDRLQSVGLHRVKHDWAANSMRAPSSLWWRHSLPLWWHHLHLPDSVASSCYQTIFSLAESMNATSLLFPSSICKIYLKTTVGCFFFTYYRKRSLL